MIKLFFAKWFAIAVHTSVWHRRRYTGEPYWYHLREVAELVKRHGGNRTQQIAAWLHDTVEDTWVPLWLIKLLFGKEVAAMVAGLTEVSTEKDGSRAHRKAIDLNHYCSQPHDTVTVKLADLLSNSWSIMKHDQKFADIFIPEMCSLLLSTDRGAKSLRSELSKVAEEYLLIMSKVPFTEHTRKKILNWWRITGFVKDREFDEEAKKTHRYVMATRSAAFWDLLLQRLNVPSCYADFKDIPRPDDFPISRLLPRVLQDRFLQVGRCCGEDLA